MRPEVGFVGPRITEPAFVRAVDDELHRLHRFLGLAPFAPPALPEVSAALDVIAAQASE